MMRDARFWDLLKRLALAKLGAFCIPVVMFRRKLFIVQNSRTRSLIVLVLFPWFARSFFTGILGAIILLKRWLEARNPTLDEIYCISFWVAKESIFILRISATMTPGKSRDDHRDSHFSEFLVSLSFHKRRQSFRFSLRQRASTRKISLFVMQLLSTEC